MYIYSCEFLFTASGLKEIKYVYQEQLLFILFFDSLQLLPDISILNFFLLVIHTQLKISLA